MSHPSPPRKGLHKNGRGQEGQNSHQICS